MIDCWTSMAKIDEDMEKEPSGSPSLTTPMDEERLSKGGLGIFDYVHDEMTMSIDLEGEIVSTLAKLFLFKTFMLEMVFCKRGNHIEHFKQELARREQDKKLF